MLASILHALIPVFVLVGIGYFFQKSQKEDPWLNGALCRLGAGSCHTWSSILNRYALHLALPALIFSSLISVDADALPHNTFIFYTFTGLICFMGLAIVLTKALRLPKDIANTYIFGGLFGNTAYIGFAYLLNLFPESGATLSLIVAIHLIVVFTLGIALLEKNSHDHISFPKILERTIKNPLLISVFLGLLVMFSDTNIPVVLTKAIEAMGNSSSPVVLIALGAFIAKEWKHDITVVHAMRISLIKLLGLPLVFLGVSFFVKSDIGIVLSALQAAMPIALSNFALAESYAINKTMMANAIIVSTILSLVTIPLLTSITLSFFG